MNFWEFLLLLLRRVDETAGAEITLVVSHVPLMLGVALVLWIERVFIRPQLPNDPNTDRILWWIEVGLVAVVGGALIVRLILPHAFG